MMRKRSRSASSFAVILWRYSGYIGLIVLVIMGLVMPVHAFLEKAFLYFPTDDRAGTPADAGLSYQAIRFPAADGQELHGWLIEGEPEMPLVVFCMGNYGNKSHRLENLRLLHQLGVGIFIFDYRGYGQSGGQPSEKGTYDDLRGAVAMLAQRGWEPERLVFFGRSLGAAVALQVALESDPAAVILETPFTSISSMGWTHYAPLYLLLGWLLEAEYDNLAKIADLRSPLLILHGTNDRICPPRMARKLYERATPPKQLEWIEGAGHNDTVPRGGENYWTIWRDFLARYSEAGADALP